MPEHMKGKVNVTIWNWISKWHFYTTGVKWFSSASVVFVDNDKNHPVRYSVQPESPKKSPSRNPECEGPRVSALMISDGVLVEQNTGRVWFLFLSRDFLNLYLHGEVFLLSHCLLLKVFTSDLLCWMDIWIVYLDLVSLGIQATIMAMSCDITLGSCDQT